LPSNRGKGEVRKAVQKVMHHVEVHRGKNVPPANKRARARCHEVGLSGISTRSLWRGRSNVASDCITRLQKHSLEARNFGPRPCRRDSGSARCHPTKNPRLGRRIPSTEAVPSPNMDRSRPDDKLVGRRTHAMWQAKGSNCRID
jgi:hypothetical protein